MDHPSIEQAVVLGIMMKMLGEDIATAIIVKDGKICSEEDVKNYAKDKLAKFKIPKKIFFVNEIPKGATGKLQRNCSLRVIRSEKVIFEGNLDSLKRSKDDVKEVNTGFECGVGCDKFSSWIEGDVIEAFKFVTKKTDLITIIKTLAY